MKKKHWTTLGLALGVLVLGMLVGLMTVGTVAADPTPGVKIQLPRIDVGDALGFCTDICDDCDDLCDPDSPRYDYDLCAACEADCDDCVQENYWETWIQVQHVGTKVGVPTGAIFMGWGEYSGLCPTNDPGVIVHYCALIKENALWTLRTQLTEAVKSGIIYTVTADAYQEACSTAELTEGNTDMWREWLKEWEFGTGMDITKDPAVEMTWGPAQGEEIAVTVTRYGPNDHGTFVSSTYTGISREMEGEDSPWEYYAPYVMKGYNGLDTELTIQNSGEDCTSIHIHYKEEGTCTIVWDQHITQLAPGEAVRVKVPCNTGQIPCFWLGSAHISAHEPLGIIVDQTSFEEPCLGPDPGTLLTHRARPKVELRDGEPIEDTKVYADLIFREWSGWDASIQVQNLSRTGRNTFVTVDFMDNSGDEILFLADWICPADSATFYLPMVTDLGFDYIGAAEIQSHDQVSFPGDVTPAQPIFAVVDLKKPDSGLTPQMDAQGGSYNAHPESQKKWVSQIALPFMAKGAADMYTPWTSLIAIRNNSNCNKIKAKIWFKIETGELVCDLPIPWLHPKHVKLIDLNDIGCLIDGYVGSAKVIITDFEQLCDTDNDGNIDNEPLMPSVIVVEKGHYGSGIDGGDVTNIYEGIPYATNIPACYGDIFGQVVDYFDCDPDVDPDHLFGTTVTITDTTATVTADTTAFAGMYEVEHVAAGAWEGSAVRDGFLTRTITGTLDCGEDLEQSWDLVCTNPITFTVNDSQTPAPLPGATVTITFTNWYDSIPWGPAGQVSTSGTTNALGQVVFNDIPTGTDEVARCGAGKGQTVNWSIELAGYETEYSAAPHIVLTDGSCAEEITRTVPIDHLGYIQGYVWCGTGTNDTFDPGETAMQNTWVRLYNWQGTLLKDSTYTNASGWYQFTVDPNVSYDVIVNTLRANDMFITPNFVMVANFELCVAPHAITYP